MHEYLSLIIVVAYVVLVGLVGAGWIFIQRRQRLAAHHPRQGGASPSRGEQATA